MIMALLSPNINPNLGLSSSSSSSSSSSNWAFNRNLNQSPTTRITKHRNNNINLLTLPPPTPRASSSQESGTVDDCNDEECAPDKEVGKVSMEWLAGDKTRVTGTFPPKKRGWTGYVEKDTAGQTNIYPVEPVVYIAESAISSGTAGSSSNGAENTLAVAVGFGLISIAAASSILLQVGKTSPPEIPTLEYSGPSLTYYITKFKPGPAPPPPPPPQIVQLIEPDDDQLTTTTTATTATPPPQEEASSDEST